MQLPPIYESRDFHLDADSMVYRLAFQVDLMEGGPALCSRLLDKMIDKCYEHTQSTDVKIYLGTDTNYRLDIAKTFGYKANRDKARRPQFYDAIRSRMINFYGAKLVEGREAEDAVGIAAFEHEYYDDYIVGAIDKDMRMIPGYHYNYAKETIEFIDPVQAARNFYMQLLTGDKSVDNIPGLYHLLDHDGLIKEANAFKGSRYKKKLKEKLNSTEDAVEMYNHVMDYYKEYGEVERNGYERIREVGQLLWIQRDIIKVWEPGEHNQDIINTVHMRHRDEY